MKHYEVKVLKAGYATWVGPTQQRADGTISLIKGAHNIVVDTGGPWDKPELLKALRREGISPADIDYLVCTHGHSDHVGNVNLFPNATVIISYDVSKGDLYTFHPFSEGQAYRIDDEIEIIPTPGHTEQDISVVVRTVHGTYVIAGDLFESKDDLENEELWRSFSEHPEIHKESRKRVLEFADYIIPGHGDMFRVTHRSSDPPPNQSHSEGGWIRHRLVWYISVPLAIGIAAGLIVVLLTHG
jgi:glyoxylase-like metal-dependent hydrolase (beta-lactamase superfamily II)